METDERVTRCNPRNKIYTMHLCLFEIWTNSLLNKSDPWLGDTFTSSLITGHPNDAYFVSFGCRPASAVPDQTKPSHNALVTFQLLLQWTICLAVFYNCLQTTMGSKHGCLVVNLDLKIWSYSIQCLKADAKTTSDVNRGGQIRMPYPAWVLKNQFPPR